MLVAGGLLQAQMMLRAFSRGKYWPTVEDVKAFLPTSAWQENRSSLADELAEDVWTELVMVYGTLEIDRARFVIASRLPAETLLPAKEAESMKQFSDDLGRLRRKLGIGGGWLDELLERFPRATHGV
jgi:hypothetical protein